MWVGVIITLFIGGFLFYYFARAHKHIEDDENTIKITQDVIHSKTPEKKDSVLMKENMTFKYILNVFKNKFKKEKVPEQPKFNITYTRKIFQVTNKDVTGLYLFDDIGNSILYTYGMLVAVSLPKVPTGWAIRILTGWWWMYCLLVVVAYKASLTAILANPDTRL